jgi:hypothetical protein
VSSEPKLPSEVEFASFLVYNPGPEAFPSDVSALSRRIRTAVKRETAQWARRQQLGERVHTELGDTIRDRFLPKNATLVPMPGHAPMKVPDSHWSCRELCEVFVAAGLGARWLPLLERTEAVPKAAFSAPEDGPTVTMHYETIRARSHLAAGSILTVIDDVVTRGATMLAAIARLREVYPDAIVRGFALIRTVTSEPITEVKAPCAGLIRQVPWGTQRTP